MSSRWRTVAPAYPQFAKAGTNAVTGASSSIAPAPCSAPTTAATSDLLTENSRCRVWAPNPSRYSSATIEQRWATAHPSVAVVAITAPTVLDTPSVLVIGISAMGALAAGNCAVGPVPREINAVGTKSSTCWNDHCEYGADSQLSSEMPTGTRPGWSPITRAASRDRRVAGRSRAAAAHARATSRETIGVAGVSGVEVNCA